jgi:hypothetical protein
VYPIYLALRESPSLNFGWAISISFLVRSRMLEPRGSPGAGLSRVDNRHRLAVNETDDQVGAIVEVVENVFGRAAFRGHRALSQAACRPSNPP